MSENVLFSVIIPLYNCASTLNACLQSISSQTYESFEVILVDNNSSDLTADIAKEYCATDIRFKLIRESNQGISYALNAGVNICKGVYIARMDGDDIAEPEWLRLAFQKTVQDPETEFFSFAYQKFEKVCGDGQVITHPVDADTIRGLLLVCSPIAHPGSIIRRSVAVKFPYLNVKAEDHNLWCRLARRHKPGNVNFVALNYRVSGNGLSDVNRRKIYFSTLINSSKLFFSNPAMFVRLYKNFDVSNLSVYPTVPLRRVMFLKRVFDFV